MVYDTFADEYIDEKDMEMIAPPERYVPITTARYLGGRVVYKVIIEDYEDGDTNNEKDI